MSAIGAMCVPDTINDGEMIMITDKHQIGFGSDSDGGAAKRARTA